MRVRYYRCWTWAANADILAVHSMSGDDSRAISCEGFTHVWHTDLSVYGSLCGVMNPETAVSLRLLNTVALDSLCPVCVAKLPRNVRAASAP
jgi:hypothetical protein